MKIGKWKIQWWHDRLYRHWALGFELYRTPSSFSRGRGPEYGCYLYFGPWRGQLSIIEPIDLIRLRQQKEQAA